jgi:hypothetical protein
VVTPAVGGTGTFTFSAPSLAAFSNTVFEIVVNVNLAPGSLVIPIRLLLIQIR